MILRKTKNTLRHKGPKGQSRKEKAKGKQEQGHKGYQEFLLCNFAPVSLHRGSTEGS
jgi:hypothetical protein